MDLATIIGLILGFGFVISAIVLGDGAAAFWNPQSLLIVVGGTLASTLIKFPLPVLLTTTQVIKNAFVARQDPPDATIRLVVKLAQAVRRDSILAMEQVPVREPFLKRAVALAVDGADPGLIESVLRAEIAAELDRHERGQRIFRSAGQAAPAFGMIGTLIGLVQMLSQMDDPSRIGGAMAVAILTTFYGAALAYLVFLPIADKLAERSREAYLDRELVVQGLISILSGHHPRLVERRLHSLLSPTQRGATKRTGSKVRKVA